MAIRYEGLVDSVQKRLRRVWSESEGHGIDGRTTHYIFEIRIGFNSALARFFVIIPPDLFFRDARVDDPAGHIAKIFWVDGNGRFAGGVKNDFTGAFCDIVVWKGMAGGAAPYESKGTFSVPLGWRLKATWQSAGSASSGSAYQSPQSKASGWARYDDVPAVRFNEEG